jgi:ribonuclease D
MSDEKLIKFALGKEVMSTSTDKKFNNFLNKNPEIENIALSTKYHAQPTNNEKKQKEQLQKLIAIKATQYNLQPELIANTKAILNYIRGDNSVCLCKGWRYEILKEELTC